jgi:hypothetical protein
MAERRSRKKRQSEEESGNTTLRLVGAATLALFEACSEMGINIDTAGPEGFGLSDGKGNKVDVPLYRLLGEIRGQDEARWPELIRTFLDGVGPAAITRVQEVLDAGLQKNKDRLMPCIKPGQMATDTPKYWSQPLCRMEAQQDVLVNAFGPKENYEEAARRVRKAARDRSDRPALLSVLIGIDLPTTIAYAYVDMVEKSGRPGDDWLRLARKNLLNRTPDDWFAVVHEESGILGTMAEDSYDASRALVLDELLPGRADRGWFVAPISRDEVYFVPATAKSSAGPIRTLRNVALKESGKSNHALSDDVFWVYQGTWHHYPFVEIEGNAIGIPPEEFQRVFRIGPQYQEQAPPPPPAPPKPSLKQRAFACPHCRKPVSAGSHLAGKLVKCPSCGQTMQIPK